MTNKKTTEKTPEVTELKPERSWNIGAVFFGLLLVAFGGLLLLGNFGVVDVRWSELWRLWPLFIVATGFSILASTHWLWKVLSLLFVVAALFAVVVVGTGQYKVDNGNVSVQDATITAEQGVAQADVTLKAGASRVTINSADIDATVSAQLRSDDLRLVKTTTIEGSMQKIMLSGDNNRTLWFGPHENTWDITLNRTVLMKLTIDAGASSVDADLSNVKLTDLRVEAGASSTVLTVGSKVEKLNIDIDSGASSTTLRIPKDSGVQMNFEGGLSSRNFDGLTEVSKGKYESENFKTAKRSVLITADAGLASFTIERY